MTAGVLSVVLSILALNQGTAIAATSRRPAAPPPAGYLEALKVANAFLWAWTMREQDEGIQLMSRRLRTEVKDETRLRQFMSGLSNPHHQAFEIGRGRKVTADRYIFPVVVYELYTGERSGDRYRGTLEVINDQGTWAVDRLPKSSGLPE